ncbi:DNA-binding transcriptional regulator, MarR family [Saccharopolyspora kobensis]|uniref:DNA-binding transcriptional regulator, MarR family n=1 Tax=Saccharopolyspora kobensis TaxID=146035 RepID=A0A1H5W437_9PSEU|nr:DNA-binding transcriptional regulator, MarR family [Saccharopolyspora kobensis]SFD72196.1 DNA-binding transcriptional regulator, MarR family [Saccharopolyspora kobensis]
MAESSRYADPVTEPRWLSDEQQCAWRKFAALMTVVPAKLDAQLQRDAGLTHFGYWVLAMLSEHPDRALRMSDLAARANASPSRVSHVVARLEQRGWVRRQRASGDGRGNVAELTDAGHEKVVATAPGHVAKVRDLVFDGLTDDQVRQLDELCAAVLAHLDPEGTITTTPPRPE